MLTLNIDHMRAIGAPLGAAHLHAGRRLPHEDDGIQATFIEDAGKSGRLDSSACERIWMAEHSKLRAASNLGFVVWVVYGILYGLGDWTATAVAGLAIMLAIVASEKRTDNLKIIDLTSLGFFVLVLIMLVTVGDQVFNRYHIILVWSVFAVVPWATMLFGFPFTLQYARKGVPAEVCGNPLFYRVNLRHCQDIVVNYPGRELIVGYVFNRLYLARYRTRFRLYETFS